MADAELRKKFEDLLQSAMSDEVLLPIQRQVETVVDVAADQFMDWIKNSLAYELSSFVEQMAYRSVLAMLDGDEKALRQYLQCEADNERIGRMEGSTVRSDGKLFEPYWLDFRRRLVEAHAEFLKDQRILDLETQVRELVLQINDLQIRLAQTRAGWTNIETLFRESHE